jgi:hypothetical protein
MAWDRGKVKRGKAGASVLSELVSGPGRATVDTQLGLSYTTVAIKS